MSFSLVSFMDGEKALAAGCELSFIIKGGENGTETGEALTRSIIVKNSGTYPCRDVSFSLFYGNNEKFLSATPSPRASNYYWFLGSLASGKSKVVTLVTTHVAMVPGGKIITEGCVTSSKGADICVESHVSIVGVTGSTPPVIVEPSPAPNPQIPATSAKEQGMWVWSFAKDMNTPTGYAQLKQLAEYKFNAVYLTIDDYLEIATLPEGSYKTNLKSAYFKELSTFILKANSFGMVVDAEGGAKDWAKPNNKWKGFALIDAVNEYNLLYPNAKLRGFQYDVEPYILEEYEDNKEKVLTEFV